MEHSVQSKELGNSGDQKVKSEPDCGVTQTDKWLLLDSHI